jgi:hypothetical protein
MNGLPDAPRPMRLSAGVFLDLEFTAPCRVTPSAIAPDARDPAYFVDRARYGET